MGLLIIIVIILLVAIYWKYQSIQIAKLKQKLARKNQIKKDYPNAYAEYWGKYVGNLNGACCIYNTADEELNDYYWQKLEEDVLRRREAESNRRADKDWEALQNSFADEMRSIVGEKLPYCGHHSCNIVIDTEYARLKMNVWQHFASHVCLESDLDYTYNPITRENNTKFPNWKATGVMLGSGACKNIVETIYQLATKKKVLVYFSEQVDGWNEEVLYRSYSQLFFKLMDQDNPVNICFPYYQNMASSWLDFPPLSEQELLSKKVEKESPDCIIFIDAFTTNEQLKRNCEYIFQTFHNKRPVLAYFSFIKAYDREEMIQYIEKSRAKAEKIEAERRLKEAERAKLQSLAKDVFVNNVRKWTCHQNNFFYTWLFYYYPTKCDFDLNESEWDDRYTIWDFKNNPEKHITHEDHEAALDRVIPKIQEILTETFGAEYLQFLTLVCLPASTQAKNVARYEEFSRRLCEKTGMENSYEHIHFTEDGLTKNDPNNPNHYSILPKIKFDKDFFEGKNVLLFDDVVTNGTTMRIYKMAMEKMGAFVVGGMCLGKTKHERPS